MTNEDKIRKGHRTLAIKVKNRKTDPLYGLEKIPLESLYKLALEQIGEQESYIEELEEKVKAFDAERIKIARETRAAVTHEFAKEAVIEAKKTERFQCLERRLCKQGEIIKRLYDGRKDMLLEIARLNKRLEQNQETVAS